MTESSQLLREGRTKELWDKHCGHIHLSLDEYMEIQNRLLMENISLLSTSTIGKHFLGDPAPQSVEEFRERVPLTTYDDYEPFLGEKNDDVLPNKAFVWARTSGRTTINGCKWIPYTKAMYNRNVDMVASAMLMSASKYPGDVRLMPKDKLLLSTAPPPYISGLISRATHDHLDVKFIPPLEIAENMGYGERLALGFKMAMKDGIDYFMGLASVLAAMGEKFSQQSSNGSRISKDMLHPAILYRLLKATIISRTQNRPVYPKDIWKLKGVMTGGTDTNVYREKLEKYWGLKPLEGYACTEAGNMALMAWNYKGMIFVPDCAFLEFIKFEDYMKNQEDPSFIPPTCLMDELEEGIYELVFTNFSGGVLVRYRIGDLFEVIAVKDNEINSVLPQFTFFSRKQDIIDMGSILQITEIHIWKGIEAAGIKYKDWVARKELINDQVKLHIYIEPQGNVDLSLDEIKNKMDAYFSENFSDYNFLKDMIIHDPLEISFLPQGSFDAYLAAKQAAGAELAHLKPVHMQPDEQMIKLLTGVVKE